MPDSPRQDAPPSVIHPYWPRPYTFWACGRGKNDGERACPVHRTADSYVVDLNAVRLDMLDFPTAHAINQNAALEHVPACSAAQTNNALLCDCDAMEREWHRLRAEHRWPTPDETSTNGER